MPGGDSGIPEAGEKRPGDNKTKIIKKVFKFSRLSIYLHPLDSFSNQIYFS